MHEVPEPMRRGGPGPPSLAVDLSTCQVGRVVRVHGLISVVQAEDGREVRCNVRRILKTMSIDGRNVVAVGDRVWFRPVGDEGMIENVEARNAGRSPEAIATASTSSSPTSTNS